MATDDGVNRGAYVNEVKRGHKRWFFRVSVPHDYLDWIDQGRVAREPDLVARDFALVFDKMLQAVRTSSSPPQAGAASAAPDAA